ncbi:hypothetical protein Egran_04541 [Elaphomyces granulatus]|uniref:Vacuolar sorting protein Vps3844 C-terminal domain-containing protein n=1 Tax=Elaphomyces granulatus TaxID=519963 RepID=A0A232LUA2_9EURO|nr:hypothetical protein Egran_04541 [Elaphomyces granulatus]
MNHITTLLFLTSFIVSEARAHGGFIYTFDSNLQLKPSRGISLSEDSTKLVLERRITSTTESSSLGLLGEEVIEVLDRFGGLQTPLFGSAEGDEVSRKLLIVCHGVDSATVTAVSDTHPSDFYAPHTLRDFVEDSYLETLIHPTHDAAAYSEACSFDFKGEESTGDSAKLIELQECLSTQSVFRETFRIIDKDLLTHFPSVSIRSWVGETGASRNVSTDDPTLVEGFLRNLFQHLILLSELKQETTVVLLPAMSTTLQPIQIPTTRYNWKAQLVASSSNPASPKIKPRSVESNVLRETVLSSLVPSCYKTNLTCVRETNNCSGRGYCYRKYVSTDEALPNCYSCKCMEEVKKDKDGSIISRVRWGGPACQKKDVSAMFFLLASITIIVAVAVASAISQLLSVGQEELPSVIGAGVGTLRAQK